MDYKVRKDDMIFWLSPEIPPVLKVPAGSEVVFETLDCYSNEWKEHSDLVNHKMGSGNPGFGPVYIEGAESGDTLKVSIIAIYLDKQGVMVSHEGFSKISHYLKGIETKLFIIDEEKFTVFKPGIKIPLNPMIGLIGVAPAGYAVRTTLPGSHGGNLDNKMVASGSSIYFPIFTEGALFALGDIHAAMGDGEVGFNGIEISGSVTVRFDVSKNIKLSDPFLENDKYVSTISSNENIEIAIDKSIYDMTKIIRDRIDISFHELNMLMSIVGEVQICQVVSSLSTVRFNMPKSVLDKYGFHI